MASARSPSPSEAGRENGTRANERACAGLVPAGESAGFIGRIRLTLPVARWWHEAQAFREAGMLDDPGSMAAAIKDAETLRTHYGPPTSLSVRKEQTRIDHHAEAFIARSPFVVVSTASANGWPEASPRGDAPGFVAVDGPHRLLLPDRPGNNRLHSLQNVLDDGRIGLLFMVPRITHTLRVYGTARIRTDDAVRTRFAAQGKPARCVVEITVELAYFHCGKAVIRSGLWDNTTWPSTEGLGTFGKILSDQIAGVGQAEAEAKIHESYTARLY